MAGSTPAPMVPKGGAPAHGRSWHRPPQGRRAPAEYLPVPLPDDVPFFTAGAPPVAGSWEPIPASPALPQVDRRSRGLIVCAAVLGVVVVVAIGWFGLHRHGSVRVGP